MSIFSKRPLGGRTVGELIFAFGPLALVLIVAFLSLAFIL